MFSRWLSKMERTASYRPSVAGSYVGSAARGARARSFVCTECAVIVRGCRCRRVQEGKPLRFQRIVIKFFNDFMRLTPSQVHNGLVGKINASTAQCQARAQFLFAAVQANIERCEASTKRNNEMWPTRAATVEAPDWVPTRYQATAERSGLRELMQE